MDWQSDWIYSCGCRWLDAQRVPLCGQAGESSRPGRTTAGVWGSSVVFSSIIFIRNLNPIQYSIIIFIPFGSVAYWGLHPAGKVGEEEEEAADTSEEGPGGTSGEDLAGTSGEEVGFSGLRILLVETVSSWHMKV